MNCAILTAKAAVSRLRYCADAIMSRFIFAKIASRYLTGKLKIMSRNHKFRIVINGVEMIVSRDTMRMLVRQYKNQKIKFMPLDNGNISIEAIAQPG